MGIPNHAMREGTEISLRRFAAEVAEGSFRQQHDLRLPSIGLGTRVGEKKASESTTGDCPKDVHPAGRRQA